MLFTEKYARHGRYITNATYGNASLARSIKSAEGGPQAEILTGMKLRRADCSRQCWVNNGIVAVRIVITQIGVPDRGII